MGSCFKSKKKNSYTVEQIDTEYQAPRGRFSSKSDKDYTGPSHQGPQKGKTKQQQQQAESLKQAEAKKLSVESNGKNPAVVVTTSQPPDLVSDHDAKKTRNISDASTVSVKSESVDVNKTTTSTSSNVEVSHVVVNNVEVNNIEVNKVEVNNVQLNDIEVNDVDVSNVVAASDVVVDTNTELESSRPAVEEESRETDRSSSSYTAEVSADHSFHTDDVLEPSYPEVQTTTEVSAGYRGFDVSGPEDVVEARVDVSSVHSRGSDTGENLTVETPVGMLDVDVATPGADSDRESDQGNQVTFKDTPETINYTPRDTPREDEDDYSEHGSRDEDLGRREDDDEGVTGYTTVEHTSYEGTDNQWGHTETSYSMTTTTTTEYDDTGATSTFFSVSTGGPDEATQGYAQAYNDDDYPPPPPLDDVAVTSNSDSHVTDAGDVVTYDEVHMTDSPAGTWDARLNSDVRAELDEAQRSLSDGDVDRPHDVNTDYTVTTTVTTATYTTDGDQPEVLYDNLQNEQIDQDADVSASMSASAGDFDDDQPLYDNVVSSDGDHGY